MKLAELFKDKIKGVISGLDRIRFRGTLRWLANESGMKTFLSSQKILLKDFKGYAEKLTNTIRKSCIEQAEESGIEIRYLQRGGTDKEKIAKEIANRNKIETGNICLLSVVEQCISPTVKGNKQTKKIELKMAPRKCVWMYQYFNHPDYGFGHVRLQTWMPFNIFICLNGRHWLERSLKKKTIEYIKDGNCFPWIENVSAAQKLFDNQLKMNWSNMLGGLVKKMCPILQTLLPFKPEYYWSADDTEWATDILFKSRNDLDKLYPMLINYAMRVSDSAAVMKYLGKRKIELSGSGQGLLSNEIISDYRKRFEGMRVKHWINNNSVKMYNKSGSILRIETTITNTRDFKVYRHPNDDENRKPSWQKMRKGVSDLHRRCEISNSSNERYADNLAAMHVDEKLKEVVAPVCNSINKNQKKYRGINPWHKEDYKLLLFLTRGENAIAGFRNKDLRNYLYPKSNDLLKSEQKKYSGKTTRLIKLLRVHGLIKKVANQNRYMMTAKGQKFASSLLTASDVDIKELINVVA